MSAVRLRLGSSGAGRSQLLNVETMMPRHSRSSVVASSSSSAACAASRAAQQVQVVGRLGRPTASRKPRPAPALAPAGRVQIQ
eukprot:12073753-Alexandrium_andersonii.AAC.1